MVATQGIGEVTWTDLFCGAGGSSLGLHHVPGFRVRYALNHWDLAVQAHAANFPDTDHEVTLIQDVHPSRFTRTDCAWFSPSCTHHAYTRGARDLSDEGMRSRATMWDVVRWCDFHRYDIAIVENVVEVKLWCDEHGTATKGCSCGSTYDSWIASMAQLGYEAQEVYFNSQHALVPQSRDRIYVVFTRAGMRKPNLNFAPISYCSTCQGATYGIQTWKPPTKGSARDSERLLRWGRYGTQYIYICPTCDERVAPGVVGSKFIIDRSIPISTIGSRDKPLAPNTRRRIKVGLENVGSMEAVQLQVGGNLFERPGYARVWSLDDPLRTVTTTPYMAMCVPQKKRAAATSLEEPVSPVTTRSHLSLTVRAGGQAPAPRDTGEPLNTLTAHDRQIALVMQNMAHNVPRSDLEPGPPVTTGGNHCMVLPAGGQKANPKLGEEPSHTVMTKDRLGLLMYNGVPGFVRTLEDAAGTVTTRDKQSLLVPYNRTARVHPATEPLTTVTTRDRSALLEVTDEDIDACLFRMLHWTELQRAQAMHVMPDGSPYLLTARVPGRKAGTWKELSNEQRVKMIGNAVSSPVATMLGYAIAEAYAS